MLTHHSHNSWNLNDFNELGFILNSKVQFIGAICMPYKDIDSAHIMYNIISLVLTSIIVK